MLCQRAYAEFFMSIGIFLRRCQPEELIFITNCYLILTLNKKADPALALRSYYVSGRQQVSITPR